MPERVTLELSEAMVRRARAAARRTGGVPEGILAEWLERGAGADDGASLAALGAHPIFTPYGNAAAAQVLLDVLEAAETAGETSA